MRATRFWFRRTRRSPGHDCRVAYRPRLEALEDRQLLAVSASAVDPHGVFIRYNDGQLFFHDPTGFRRIDIGVASVSAGITLDNLATQVPAGFIVYNNGRLVEWSQPHGYQLIDINVVSVAAAVVGTTGTPDGVFILYNNAQLFEHIGRSPVTGFTHIADAVSSMSPTFGNGDVFYVQINHMLSEHLAGGGSTVIDGNVQSVSGGQLNPDTAFIVYTNAALYEFDPNAPLRFTLIDTNVASVGAGTSSIPGTMTTIDAAFYITRDGALVEWLAPNISSPTPDGTYVFVDGNVASISTTTAGVDDVFIVYNNGMLFEHTGLSRRSGFTFVDTNVSP
jgi:hypothetical protein